MPVKTKKWRYIGIGSGILALLLAGLLLLLLLPGEEPANGPETPETSPDTTHSLEANPFSPDDFGYDGDYLTCLTGESVLGIDVSSHQKQIDWQQVKAAGVEFVMIRLAYRGSIEGALVADEMAQDHYRGAKAAGLQVGGYIFTQSISVAEGIEDAEFVLSQVKDWELRMPLVYDWEIIDESYRNGKLDRQTLTDIMLSFCETVEAAGQEAMVYFNISNTKHNFYLEQLEGYGFWLANYTDRLDFPYRVDMWQYTCTGAVAGIAGDVDINLYFPKNA